MWKYLLNDFINFTEYYLRFDLRYVAVIFVLSVVIGAVLRVCAKKGRVTKRFASLFPLLMLYMLLVLNYTLLSRVSTGSFHYELTPFWSYINLLNGNITFVTQIVFNVLMLLPVGVLVRALGKNLRFSTLVGFIFSCSIEILQLITTRGLFEFDDIIHNTVGAFLGAFLFGQVSRLSHRKKSEC
jgi:glycopeptide antibiotics resistance protein